MKWPAGGLICTIFCLTLTFNFTLTMSFKTERYYDELPEDVSDYDIVYKCFYDHSWIAHRRHHCHSIVSGKKAKSSRHRRLGSLLQTMLKADREDRKLVAHCFAYHYAFSSGHYLPCRGISWHQKQSAPANLREARLRGLWAKELADKRREIGKARFFEGHDVALVLRCLYTTDWLSNDKHRCHEIAYSGGQSGFSDNVQNEFSKRDLHLQEMYRQERKKAILADCLQYHQTDKLNRCYGITWQIEISKR